MPVKAAKYIVALVIGAITAIWLDDQQGQQIMPPARAPAVEFGQTATYMSEILTA